MVMAVWVFRDDVISLFRYSVFWGNLSKKDLWGAVLRTKGLVLLGMRNVVVTVRGGICMSRRVLRGEWR